MSLVVDTGKSWEKHDRVVGVQLQTLNCAAMASRLVAIGGGLFRLVPGFVELQDVLPSFVLIALRHARIGLEDLVTVHEESLGFLELFTSDQAGAPPVIRVGNEVFSVGIVLAEKRSRFAKQRFGVGEFFLLRQGATEDQERSANLLMAGIQFLPPRIQGLFP